ncbi:NAD-dependent epimerase/dehydratase family protein [Lacrimispora celerecrescens]|jgi:dTDP-L-rhamnose 4-epimerase|uniref:NAD-dependent epimerase/dehydratase family protein n=1 Tax=Lacrimispora celerecrescens TaxID=29354 RepID=UPI001644F793|nr:NAD-dependent epimerase/dehydratase family protein [Lacrimispora celerecrescens]
MKILITGGAGFIGNAIINELSKDKCNEIVVLDALTEQIHGKKPEESYLYKGIADKCHFIRGDIRDYQLVEQVVKDCNYIIHLAAETGTGQSMYQINQYNEVNIMGTSNLFQAISATGMKLEKFILASSRSVYGEGKYECPVHKTVYPEARKVEDMKTGDFTMHCPICNERLQTAPTDEASKVIPNSLYAFTKYAQEKMVETMCKAMQIEYTIFRFQNVYGIGQSLKNPYTGILSIFSTLLLDNKKVNVFEDGAESRDFINVEDVASAVIKSLGEKETNGEIINLGSGVGTSVMEIAETLKLLYGSESEICITGDFRVGDIAHNIADTKKAEKLLGFRPTISLEDGLQQFTAWVKDQEPDNSGYEASLKEMELAGMYVRGGVIR